VTKRHWSAFSADRSRDRLQRNGREGLCIGGRTTIYGAMQPPGTLKVWLWHVFVKTRRQTFSAEAPFRSRSRSISCWGRFEKDFRGSEALAEGTHEGATRQRRGLKHGPRPTVGPIRSEVPPLRAGCVGRFERREEEVWAVSIETDSCGDRSARISSDFGLWLLLPGIDVNPVN